MEKFRLTRYAPTPSGYLHLGNIYSFVLTYHMAKKHGAKILLRIDDMDQERVKSSFVKDIFDTLDFMELPFDLGPKNLQEFDTEFSQKHRLPMYEKALERLKKHGILFACDCSRTKVDKMHPLGYYTGFCRKRNLPFDAPEVSWRIKADMHREVIFHESEKGEIHGKLPGILTDFVVRKKDRMPAYQLASVVDDIHYGVDLVVRGKDLWGSSLAQVLLSLFLEKNDFSKNLFLHHTLLKTPDNQKLSKSAGATSIYHLRKGGKKKEDIFNLIGTSLGRPDIMGLEDFGRMV